MKGELKLGKQAGKDGLNAAAFAACGSKKRLTLPGRAKQYLMAERFRRHLPLLLAWLALLGGQVYGLQRGYLCDCSGVAKLTTADHCHGPHSNDCHTEPEPQEPCHDAGDHALGDAVSHDAAVESLHAGQSAPALVPAPPLPAFLTFDEWLLAAPLVIELQDDNKPPPWLGESGRRAWPALLSRVISLRI